MPVFSGEHPETMRLRCNGRFGAVDGHPGGHLFKLIGELGIVASPRELTGNNTMLRTTHSAGWSNKIDFMSCPVAGPPGSGTLIAIIIEFGFFTADTTPALLAFGSMYFDHDGCICKHCYFINTSVLDI